MDRSVIRRCREDERIAVLGVINAAAEAYRNVIPPDRWRQPYMSINELEQEITSGVTFWGYEAGGKLAGVMGIQRVREVDLIRHAYVLPSWQRRSVGSTLMTHLRAMGDGQLLVGTWAAAEWAIGFYQRHGFQLVSPQTKDKLLRAYWSVPDRQIETSVVLANPPLTHWPG